MPSHLARHTLQQVKVDARAQDVAQRTIGLNLKLIHSHRAHTLGAQQLEPGTH
ncbi:hypothetical protein D3C73_1662520 [compost metagenome]